MGGVCRTFSGATLLAVASGQLVYRHGWAFMATRAPPSAGSQLVVPQSEWRSMIRRFLDSLCAGHLGILRTVFRLQTRVYWP